MDQIFRYAYYPCRLVFSHEVKWLKGVDCFFIFIHGFEKLRNLYKYLKNTKNLIGWMDGWMDGWGRKVTGSISEYLSFLFFVSDYGKWSR